MELKWEKEINLNTTQGSRKIKAVKKESEIFTPRRESGRASFSFYVISLKLNNTTKKHLSTSLAFALQPKPQDLNRLCWNSKVLLFIINYFFGWK